MTRLTCVCVIAALAACAGEDPASPIEFSSLRVEDIGPDRAVVRFDTSVPASCEAEYGVLMDRLDATAVDPDMEEGDLAIEHAVPLEGLSSNTTYYVRARAEDADGNVAYSEILQFTTQEAEDVTGDLTNVALLSAGTTVVEVSSNYGGGGNDSAYGVHKALDGSLTTEWSTAGDGDDAYVVLDLGQTRTITHVAYRSRMMSDGTSIVTRMRLVVDDGAVVLGPFDTPDHTVRYVFALAEPVTARHVRFEAVDTTGGNTGARAIQLFEP